MSGPQITIRPRRASDVPALATILQAVYADTQYPWEAADFSGSDWEDFLDVPESHALFVATRRGGGGSASDDHQAGSGSGGGSSEGEEDVVVGHIAVIPFKRNAREADWAAAGITTGNALFLGKLFVDPDARGLGVGRALVGRAMEWVRANGWRCALYVVTKDVAATALYERMGWRRIGMETYRGWDNWMYVMPETEGGIDGVKVEGTETGMP